MTCVMQLLKIWCRSIGSNDTQQKRPTCDTQQINILRLLRYAVSLRWVSMYWVW